MPWQRRGTSSDISDSKDGFGFAFDDENVFRGDEVRMFSQSDVERCMYRYPVCRALYRSWDGDVKSERQRIIILRACELQIEQCKARERTVPLRLLTRSSSPGLSTSLGRLTGGPSDSPFEVSWTTTVCLGTMGVGSGPLSLMRLGLGGI